MVQVYSIACGLPFCQNSQEKQTNLSIGFRITAVGLGTIAAIVGILILLKMPGLNQIGTTMGWTGASIGTFLAIVGISIKGVRKHSEKNPDSAEIPNDFNQNSFEKNTSSEFSNVPDKETSHKTNTSLSSKTTFSTNTPIVTDNLNIETARKTFLKWILHNDIKPGQVEYENALVKLKQIAKELSKKKMTLHHHYLFIPSDLNIYYGEEKGENKFIPLSFDDGYILSEQIKSKTDEVYWPILDPQTNSYFIPTITKISSWKEEKRIEQYFSDLIKSAQKDSKSHEYRMLQALIPDAGRIKDKCGDEIYSKIRKLMPGYPEDPV